MAIIVSLRKVIRGSLGKVLMIGLFLTMFGGFGLSKIFLKIFKTDSFDGVALVNTTDISRQAFQVAVAQEDQRIQAIRQRYGKNSDLYMRVIGIQSDPQVNALNAVIHAALLEEFAEKLGVHVSQGYIEAQFANPHFLMNEFGHLLPREVFSKDGSIDTYAVLQFLKQTGQMSAIELELKKKLAKQFAVSMVHSTFFVPSFMIKQMYVEQKLGKKFSYQKFSLDTFLQKERAVGATDEQLKAFYNEQNKISKRYWSAEKRSGQQWVFSASDYGITVEPAEIEAYYAKNKSLRFIKDPVQIKVREIVFGNVVERGLATVQEEARSVQKQLMENPDHFEKYAREYSTEKTTATKGGLVDWFKRGQKDKEYEKAAFKLKENDEISPVVELDNALVILQRVDRKEATFQPLELVKNDIKKALVDQKFRVEFNREAHQVVRQDNDKKGLQEFVFAHKGAALDLENITKNVENLVSQRLFALKNVGDLAVFMQEGKGIILQYKNKKQAAMIPFEEIKNTIASDYYESKATKALEAAVKKAKEQSILQKKMVQVEGGTIAFTDWVTLQDEKKIEELIKLGFPKQFIELDWLGAVTSSLSEDGGTVVRLDEIEEFKQEKLEEQQQSLLKDVFERTSTLFSQAFIASLFRNATIKVNNELSRVKDQL